MYTASAEASTSLLHRNKIIELNAWALIIINRSNIKEKKNSSFWGQGIIINTDKQNVMSKEKKLSW